ncbi:MAG: DNA polymerase III subunit gamma/tau [Candidatus Kapaibacterium sp.]
MADNSNGGDFVVTARKWRPLRFSDVVGQEHITRTLRNSIKSNRIHHAFLFSGPRGVGKTTTARILARALNCTNSDDSEPCNECESCLAILAGRSYDVIEIDGASNNSVDDIRKLRDNVKYPPVQGNYKMYIIDEVHMLSNSAFNALLKTLEEPPPHLIFVFATTEAHKVPATIISRCQRFDFRRMEISDITSRLRFIAEQEDIAIDDESLMTIAKKADGSMRDGQSLFDQVVAFCGTDIKYSDMADALHLIDRDFYFRISSGIRKGDLAEMFAISRDVSARGYDVGECLAGLLEHFRNILTIQVTGTANLIESSENYLKMYEEAAENFEKADLLRYMNIITKIEQSLKFAPQPGIKFEICLVQLASMESTVRIADLINELKNLKKGGDGSSDFFRQEPSSPKSQSKKDIYIAPTENKSAPKIQEPVAEQSPASPGRAPESDEPPAAATSGNTVPADELRHGWSEFLQKFANGSNGLSMIKSAIPSFHNGEIILHVPQSFIFENLTLKRQNILNAFAEYWGRAVGVKIVESDSPPAQEIEVVSRQAPDEPEINTKPPEKSYSFEDSREAKAKPSEEQLAGKHPIERAILEMFDAEEKPEE